MTTSALHLPSLLAAQRSGPAGTTLEVAAKELTNSSADAAVVTDATGKPLGLITLRKITAALSSAAEAH